VSDAEKTAILRERIGPDRAVLLIVDMQNDFVSPEGKMAQFGFEIGSVRETIQPIREVLEAARSSGYPIIHTSMINEVTQNPPSWYAFWGEPAITLPGSWGAAHIEELKPREGEAVLTKYTYGAFLGTNLDTMLRRLEVSTILVTGTDLNICAGDTMHQAFAIGYHVVAVSDCLACFSRIGREHAEKLKAMGLYLIENHYGLTVDSTTLIEIMSRSG
jgi:nicotinamidase-related amidase